MVVPAVVPIWWFPSLSLKDASADCKRHILFAIFLRPGHPASKSGAARFATGAELTKQKTLFDMLE